MYLLVTPVLRKDDQDVGDVDVDLEDVIDEEADSEDDEEKAVLCAQCESEVTSRRHKTSVQGSFEHEYANPSGVFYRIGCFEEAPGCGATGEETSKFTWFAGYTWQIVLCRGCHTHLGWRYHSSEHVFFGLILPRLLHWED